MKKTQSVPKLKDNLRVGYQFLGKSTYQNIYNQPNPEDYTKKTKVVEKLSKDALYKHQFGIFYHNVETIYRKDLSQKQMNTECPAKAALRKKMQGASCGAKANLSENANFKALSPEFHAISTAKH